MDNSNWKHESLVRTASEQFEAHSKKIENLLSAAQEKFSKDHTGATAGVGILMIAASFVLMWFDRPVAFSITALVLGTATLGVALLLRHRSAEKQITYSRTMMDLERERARFAQKQAVLSHVWLHGVPEGTSLAQLQILLGDSPTASADKEWKQIRHDPDVEE